MIRRALPLLALLLLAPPPVLAEDILLGTITSTGASANNSTTAVPFTIATNQQLAVQCDAAAYVIAGTTGSALTVTSATGEYVSGNQFWPLGGRNHSVNAIAVISVSGTVNCKVFKLLDPYGK